MNLILKQAGILVMKYFYKALISEVKNEALPEEFNYFGKLIGSWKIDYIDTSTSRKIKGE